MLTTKATNSHNQNKSNYPKEFWIKPSRVSPVYIYRDTRSIESNQSILLSYRAPNNNSIQNIRLQTSLTQQPKLQNCWFHNQRQIIHVLPQRYVKLIESQLSKLAIQSCRSITYSPRYRKDPKHFRASFSDLPNLIAYF